MNDDPLKVILKRFETPDEERVTKNGTLCAWLFLILSILGVVAIHGAF